MKIIVLAMHGSPPKDFPAQELIELMSLHPRIERAPEPQRAALEARHHELEDRMRKWPRTRENDPFFSASQELAGELSRASGCEVILGFNEFCAPSLDQALDRAAQRRPAEVVVITPMMTRGGEHSEKDIPAAIDRARKHHPGVEFRYVWPFDPRQVAEFLAAQAGIR